MECPRPELDGLDIDGRDLGSGAFAVGELMWNETEGWTCLANVDGRLCRVSVGVK